MTKNTNKATNFLRKRWVKILLFLLVVFCIGWYYLDRWSKKHGFNGAGDFVITVSQNYISSFDANYETIEITISDNDYMKLSDQRDEHLAKGMITKGQDRFVPAIITYNGKKIKTKIRLKGHMTDHLQENKWSFRVKTIGGDAFLGMKTFTLQHPGTRNYIYEWIYHQLLESEGVASVRYSFLNLKLNGESWGIYALEEHFASELIHYRKLPDGPILGFNPDMYWFARLNEHEHIHVDLQNMGFNATYPEAYSEDDFFKNNPSRELYSQALSKFNRFLDGKATVSQTFDIPKLAKFHAILDLVGGQFSLDWSDVKYYYNPVTCLLEPLGYESFSVRNTENLSGAFYFRNHDTELPPWHSYLFSDPEFYQQYIKELKRISKTKYLDQFFDKINEPLHNNLNIIYSEFPYIKFDFSGYYKNQKNIKRLLNSPATHGLYLESIQNDTLTISCVSTSVYPFKVHKIIINDSVKLDYANVYLPVRQKNERVYTSILKIPIHNNKINKKSKIQFEVSIPGNSKKHTLNVKSIQTDNGNFEFKDERNLQPNYTEFDFIHVNNESKSIIFDTGQINISKTIVIPNGFKVVIVSPCEINFTNYSSIVSSSPISVRGTEEEPVYVTSEDSTGSGFVLLNVGPKSVFKDVKVYGNFSNEQSKSVFTFYESLVYLENLEFNCYKAQMIYAGRCNLFIKNSTFHNGSTALLAEFSTVNLARLKFSEMKKGLSFNACSGKIQNISLLKLKEGIKIEKGSNLILNQISIENVETAFKIYDLSKINIAKITLSNVSKGFIVGQKSDVFGPSEVNVSDLKFEKVLKLKKVEKESILNISLY